MNKKQKSGLCLWLLISFYVITQTYSTAQQQPIARYIKIKSEWSLDTPDAITHYLPARLKTLVTYFKQNGLESTISWIEQDPDLDSYWFIINTKEPYRVLAYSRAPELANKTPKELQKTQSKLHLLVGSILTHIGVKYSPLAQASK